MDEFRDQVVLITGVGQGVGPALAETFATCGAVVAANDLTPVNIDRVVARIVTVGGRIRAYEADVAKKIPVQTMIHHVMEDWGRIDILINNTNVAPKRPLLNMDEWDWHRTLDVNLTGSFLLTQTVGQLMRASGGGAIVNLAMFPEGMVDFTGHAAYLTSRMGLVGFSHIAGQELATDRIRVNALCSAEFAHLIPAQIRQVAPSMNPWLANLPPGILGHPVSITGPVLFLCSQAASDLTGGIYIAAET